MKKIIFILTIGLLFGACDTSEIEPVIDPEQYPLVTFNLVNSEDDGATFVESEQDTILVNVSLDKPVNHDLSFTATQVDGNAVEGEDYIVVDGVIPAYNTNGQVSIVIANDVQPEENLNATLEIVVAGEFDPALVHPATQPLQFGFTIVEENLEGSFAWDDSLASDLDVYVFNEAGEVVSSQATGDMPETNEFILASAPDGTYYFGIHAYAVESESAFSYTWTFRTPEGLEVIEGTFDYENRDTAYESIDIGAPIYLLVKVVKTGTSYEITSLE